ncbi:MAG: ABC transporter ATP-binding protein [Velocimicrobium sp.]
MIVLQTNNIKKYYGENETIVKALDGIDLSIEHGTFNAIVGISGSGKSTLLNMLGGIDQPTFGEILIAGKNIACMKKKELTVFRRRNIGFIFQSYNLLPIFNVFDNIALPVKLDVGNQVDKSYIEEIMDCLEISNKKLCYPNQLSGGQQQRVAIARALANKPAIVLADEPTGNLDTKTTMEVICLLKETSDKFHQTIVMVTHNEEIAQLCDRVIRIEDGKILERWGDSR